jgi:hypothetical protein
VEGSGYKPNVIAPTHGKGVLLLLGTQLFTLLVINALENGLGIRNFTEGVLLGLICGLGWVGSFTLSNALFSVFHSNYGPRSHSPTVGHRFSRRHIGRFTLKTKRRPLNKTPKRVGLRHHFPKESLQ